MDDNGVITVRDLRRRYGGPGGRGFDAVRGVTFSVRRGELLALLGTNRAGKTSVMEVLQGLAPAARGAVRVLGCDPCRERALVQRRMGIMLQEGGFAPDLTVAETGRMWAGTLSAPRPVAEALGLVSLGHSAGVAVRSLSGGERRRLDLAMAILGRPEVLFLDEPTTGLDQESRRRTWLLIRELLGAGTTVVLTTHYLEEAEELADRLAIMYQGRIVRAGTPAEVAASQPAAESVLPALVKAEIGTQHISSLSWAASLALLDLSGDCLSGCCGLGPGDGGNLAALLDERPTRRCAVCPSTEPRQLRMFLFVGRAIKSTNSSKCARLDVLSARRAWP